MNGVEKEIPEELAERLLHDELLAHIQFRRAFPVILANRVHTLVERLVAVAERLHGVFSGGRAARVAD